MDRLASLKVFANDVDDGANLVFTLGDESIYASLEVGQCFSNSGVQNYHCTCAVSLRTNGTELEAVASKGKWRCTVAVGVIDE